MVQCDELTKVYLFFLIKSLSEFIRSKFIISNKESGTSKSETNELLKNKTPVITIIYTLKTYLIHKKKIQIGVTKGYLFSIHCIAR